MVVDPDDTALATQLNEEGRRLQITGDYTRARRYFKAAVKMDPCSALAFYNLATIDFLQGRKSLAVRRYKRIVDGDFPASFRADSLIRLGNIAYDEERLDESYGYYSRALDIVADDTHEDERARLNGDALLGLGLVEKERGNMTRAGEFLHQSVRADPLNVAGYEHLAHFYDLSGDSSTAVSLANHAIELAESLPNQQPAGDMWLCLGRYQERLGDTVGALSSYRTALTLGDVEAEECISNLQKGV